MIDCIWTVGTSIIGWEIMYKIERTTTDSTCGVSMEVGVIHKYWKFMTGGGTGWRGHQKSHKTASTTTKSGYV